MTSRKVPGLALMPTAIMFGLGIGNLWGLAGMFTRIGNPGWIWVLHIALLAVLVGFLSGVARAWWARGAAIPLFLIIVAAWVFSAPYALIAGKFTMYEWALWFVVLSGCGGLALLVAWLLERGRSARTGGQPTPGMEG